MIIIRRATGFDVDWLLGQLRQFAHAYGTSRSLFPPNDAIAHAVVTSLVVEHAWFIGENDGNPLGFIAGALVRHPYNAELRVLQELFWWVDPAMRGSTVGSRLLDAFIAYGRANADWITMTLEAHSPIGDRVLKKRGFRPHEQSFLLEVPR